MLTQICSRCNTEKELTEFSFDNRRISGRTSSCKKCDAERASLLREKYKNRKTIIIPESKTCPKCKTRKNNSDFGRSKTASDSLVSWCRKCMSDGHKEEHLRNKQNINKNIPNYKLCPKCKQNKQAVDFYNTVGRVDGLSAYCKPCSSDYSRDKRSNKKYKERRNNQIKERIRKDPYYKFLILNRSRIRDALKYNRKTGKSVELLGCTGKEGMEYLEKLFWPGMTIENMGKNGWHIDHIIPVTSFDLSKPEEQRRCFHYTNLQPLWWDDNQLKHDSLTWTPALSKHELPERLKQQASTKAQNQSDAQRPLQQGGGLS